jgi:hypothetical protein
MRWQNGIDASNRIEMRCEMSSAQSRFAFKELVIVFGLREISRISTAC